MTVSQYWAYYKVKSHSVVQEAQRELGEVLPEFYEKEDNYHLTVHPQFQFDESEHDRFEHYLHKNFPSEINIHADSFYYHPEKDKPLVICFSATPNIPFQKAQQNLVNDIENNGGKSVISPVPPHITIYADKDRNTTASARRIPSNVNQIKTKCEKLEEKLLPVTFKSNKLHFETVNR